MSCIGRCLPVIAALAFLGDPAPAQDKKPPVIGEMIVQTIPKRHYVYGAIDTDFKSMGKPVGETIGSIIKNVTDNKLALVGPVMHFYYGAPHTKPDKPFKMETGFFVQGGSKGIGDFKVRELPEFKCATILYVGPGAKIGEAWVKLYSSVKDNELKTTGEERELYLYYEGPDSVNNIVQVMVGVK
ncbi:MAG: GyrI-like domain-containing protein [Planctomycetes bacterium]|nr:GyrI-like domain-containing protein [Planctomycetota bacterium]